MTEFSHANSIADRIAEAMHHLANALQSLGDPSVRNRRRLAGASILRAARSLRFRRQGNPAPSPAERARLAATHAILEDALATLKRG